MEAKEEIHKTYEILRKCNNTSMQGLKLKTHPGFHSHTQENTSFLLDCTTVLQDVGANEQ